MRNRGSAIVIEKNKVALIRRKRVGQVYYVFPGGGVEKGETPEQATIREAYEELGIHVQVRECFSKVKFHGTQYFFLTEVVGGNFGFGVGEEYTDPERKRGTYEPVWFEIAKLTAIDVRPREVAVKIYQLYS
ncbi:NUDIX domain-containing protein [Bacillus shivajii]|uniref:NUDIX hydrolase n=1 Tax=Bacillus shivajii TaxID=1983719 RepID=UPI001CF93EF2|nr:NUDIX domain-containing protein [Bacillus shivajii]UCZ51757.1 NUDIX domain-containing protein [Bacillus shivajii]